MKKFKLYFANGAVEIIEAKNLKGANLIGKRREKEIPMVLLQIYEI